MPLDPQAQALLDQVKALGGPPLNELSPPDARVAAQALGSLSGPPEAVAKVENRTIPGPAGALPVRVYTPAGSGPVSSAGLLPRWRLGHRRPGALRTARVAPWPTVPAAWWCRSTTAWRLSTSSRRRRRTPMPPRNGSPPTPPASTSTRRASPSVATAPAAISAAVMAQMARDRGGPRLVFQLLVYPVTDGACDTASYRDNADGYLLTQGHDAVVLEPLCAQRRRSARIRWPHRCAPRACTGCRRRWCMTAEFDPLRDEGEAYAARLAARPASR